MECDGTCLDSGTCTGIVRKVFVVDWGFFNYCDTCIDKDRENGFIVIEQFDEEGTKEWNIEWD